MKKTEKLGLGVLALAAVVAGGYWLYVRTKKTYKELVRRDEENREILKKSGLTPEEVDQMMVENAEKELSGQEVEEKEQDFGQDLCKTLFRAVRFESDIPVECFDVDHIYERGSERVIHVQQRFDKRSQRDVLDLLFQIPLTAPLGEKWNKNNPDMPSVRDFKRAIRGEFDHDKGKVIDRGYIDKMEEIARDEKNVGLKITGGKFFVESYIEGYYYITFEEQYEGSEEWTERSGMVRIAKTSYENNPWNPDHTKVIDYVRDLHEEKGDADYIEIPFSGDNIRNVKVMDAVAVIRATFNIQGGKNLDGLNKTSALEILNDIYYNFEIYKDHGSKKEGDKYYYYDYFVFYNPDPEGDRLEVFQTKEDAEGNSVVFSEELF